LIKSAKRRSRALLKDAGQLIAPRLAPRL